LPPAGPDSAQWCAVSYIDGVRTRREVLRSSGASDTYLDWQQRISHDNGRTWTAPAPLPGVVDQRADGGVVTYPAGVFYEPAAAVCYERVMRRLWPGLPVFTFDWGTHCHPFTDHCFVIENGQERLLRYEDGPDYDAAAPFADAFTAANRAYFGVGMTADAAGTVWYPLVCRPDGRSQTEGGVVLMRRSPETAEWLPSNQVFAAPDKSARGLLEPDVARLRDGRLLVIARGCATPTTPGCKWVSLSEDGGRSLSAVEPLRFDDGGELLSPSSIHRFQRSTRTGTLYWLANIVDTPEAAAANGRRHPLCIAAINENTASVIRDSVIVVDDRRPDDCEELQLSNFSVIEDRETLDFEIYITRIGSNPEHFWGAGVDRYVFSPV
jgi:hypothetical protein